ncbi:8868_t:CDS:2 [Rhizophagus irregularis]|nr:8868_t:CDS:2 [Rhizophagus irregularis]
MSAKLTKKKKEGTEKVDVAVCLSAEKYIIPLRLEDSLTKVREELVKISEINMNEKLFDNGIGIIPFKMEDTFKLKGIVRKTKSYELLLKVNLWKHLNETLKFKLDYGFKMTLKKASERAFAMSDCNVFPLATRQLTVKNESNDDQTAGKELSFNSDLDTAGIPLSFGISGNKSSVTGTNSSDETTYYYKNRLEFKEYLEPTENFLAEVKNAMNLNDPDPRKFKKIVERYGQIIPTEIIMGGKDYKKEFGTSKDKSQGFMANIKIPCVEGRISSNLREDICKVLDEDLRKNLRERIFSIIGERILHSGIETCICTFNGGGSFIEEFKTIPKKILDMISEEADISIFAVVFDTKDKKKSFLNVKFKAFSKDKDDDFFNCQIICHQGQKPKYVICCNQKDSELSGCDLKIKYMIVGKYTNFNSIDYDELDSDIQLKVIKNDINQKFNKSILPGDSSDHFIGTPVLKDSKGLKGLNQGSIVGHYFYTEQDNVGVFTFNYCPRQKKYVDLPTFSFYTLKISNIYGTSEAIVENVDDVEDESTDQEIIQKLKLNHGLFLNDYTVQPSEQAIYDDNGELDVDLYDEPLVYTDINLSFDDNFDNNFETSFQPYDACINFPFAKVSFNGDLLVYLMM